MTTILTQGGSLNATSDSELLIGFYLIPPLLIAGLWLSAKLEQLSLGVTIAHSHGISVFALRMIAIIIALVAISVAVYIAGPVAFIALASGPIVRQLSGKKSALVLSGLMGALLLISADLLARMLFSPTELPVGLFTATLGGVFLLWMLSRQSRKGFL